MALYMSVGERIFNFFLLDWIESKLGQLNGKLKISFRLHVTERSECVYQQKKKLGSEMAK